MIAYECVGKFIKMIHEHMNIPEQAGVWEITAGKCANKVIPRFMCGICKQALSSLLPDEQFLAHLKGLTATSSLQISL